MEGEELMGFFSWRCKGCNHSILNPYSVTKTNAWMMETVLLPEDGSVVHGEYDGYGRLEPYGDGMGTVEMELNPGPCLWHRDCWEHQGKPGYDGPSEYAGDQGFFFNPEDHDFKSPKETGELPPRAQGRHSARSR